MTIAYWALLTALFVPYLFTGFAKFTRGFGPRENHYPRAWEDKLDGPQQRAHWAQLNSFEVTPAFAAAVLVAHQVASAAQSTIDAIAVAFVISRLVYGVCYIRDLAQLRTLVWSFGMICIAALFVVSA